MSGKNKALTYCLLQKRSRKAICASYIARVRNLASLLASYLYKRPKQNPYLKTKALSI